MIINQIEFKVSYDHEEWILRDIEDWYYRLFKPEALNKFSKRRFKQALRIDIAYAFDGRHTHDVKLVNETKNEHISDYITWLITTI